MNGRLGDFHTHTTASDGTQAPAENVRMAKAAGLAAIAITDHDTLAGIAEAQEEGRRLGVTIVPGVEISTVAEGRDIHVLGYWIDPSDELFQERLAGLRSVRDRRNEMILDRLNELGMPITMDEVIASMGKAYVPGETIGRPHIAETLVRKGFVRDLKDAFDRFLGSGAAAYVNPPRIAPQEAVRWIHEAGGCAVLAHPGLYGDDDLVLQLIGEGLDGIESFHSDHTPEQASHYAALAAEHGLAATGGSDFHGERSGEVFHGAIGSHTVSLDIMEAMGAKRRQKPYEQKDS